MSLKETYFGNLENVKKMDPGAVIIDVTRRAGSVLSPSWTLLNAYKVKKIDWDGYISGFMREMDNPECKSEMRRIWELARTKDVYLVCFERVGNCHRFLLVDMIKGLMLDDACRRVNKPVIARSDLVKASYDTIAKALRLEA
ncbi:MAG: DUF488 family protein [Candidatus Methanoperedens sp.]|nr:DUF488 family protein [Candidatus Methanoperedens sp.]MCE8428523.1 DUF488 family protein [Candidatus Methanoperedens sp.]